jgi:hypothetical protein
MEVDPRTWPHLKGLISNVWVCDSPTLPHGSEPTTSDIAEVSAPERERIPLSLEREPAGSPSMHEQSDTAATTRPQHVEVLALSKPALATSGINHVASSAPTNLDHHVSASERIALKTRIGRRMLNYYSRQAV